MEIVGKVFYLLTFIRLTYQMPLPVVQLQLQPGNEKEITIGDLYYSKNCEIKVSFREPSQLYIKYLDTDDSLNNQASGPREGYSLLTYRNSPTDIIEVYGTGTENNHSFWRIQASHSLNGTAHTFFDISSVDIRLKTPNCLHLNINDTTSDSNGKRWNGKIIIIAFRLNCSIPQVPEFGNIKGPYRENNTIEFVCLSGFVLQGRKYLSCVQNESGEYVWNGLPPSCVQDSCPAEENRVFVLDEDNYIATPGFPVGITFTKNVTCSWKLIPQKYGNCIAIKIITIELPPGVRTYFEIFEMLDNSSRRILFSSLNSSDINMSTFTTCNKGFAIYFKSNEVTRHYKGVYLSYTSRPDTSGYQAGRYRKVHLNTTQDVLPITPTISTRDSRATGSSHKLKAGVIAAAVIIPIVAVIVIAAIILYVWYRKKYPVRMIIGKDFGKFTNPAYEKRHSTATLTRQQDSFEKEIEKMSVATGVSHYNPVDLSDESDFHQQYQPMATESMLLKNMGYRDSLHLTDDGCNRDSITYNSSTKKKIIHPEIDFKDATDGDSSENEGDSKSYTYMDKPSQHKVHNTEDESDVSSEMSSRESVSSGNEDNSDDDVFKPTKNVPNVRRKRVSAYLNEVVDRQISEEASVNKEHEIQNEPVLSNETDRDTLINESNDESDGRENGEEIHQDVEPRDMHVYENVVIGDEGMMNKPEIYQPILDKEATNEEKEEEEDNSYFYKGITPVHVQADESSTNDASSADESVSDSEPKSYSFNTEVYDDDESEMALPDNELGKNETRRMMHLNIGDEIVNSKLDENTETHEDKFSESSDAMVLEHPEDASGKNEGNATNVLDLEFVPNSHCLDIAQIELSDISNDPNTNNYEHKDISGSSESLHTMDAKTKRIKTLKSFPSFSIDGGSMESLASVEYVEFEKSELELSPVQAGDNDSSENKLPNDSPSICNSSLVQDGFSEFFSDENHTLLPDENSNKTIISESETELKFQHFQISTDDRKNTLQDQECNVESLDVSEGNSETFSDSTINLGLITMHKDSTEDENNSFQNSKIDLPSVESSTNPFDNLSDDPSLHQTNSTQLQKYWLDVGTLGIEENGSDTEIETPSSSEKEESDEEEKLLDSQGTSIPEVRRQSVTLDNTIVDLPNSYQYSGNSPNTNISPEEIVPKRHQSIISDNPATGVTNIILGKSADDSLRVIRPDFLVIDDSGSISHSSSEESVSDDEDTNGYTVNPVSDKCCEVFGFGESTDDTLILPLSFDQSTMDEIKGTKGIPALNVKDFDNPFKGKMNDSDESDISIASDVIKEISSDSDTERVTLQNVRKKSSFKVNLTPDLHAGDNDSVDV